MSRQLKHQAIVSCAILIKLTVLVLIGLIIFHNVLMLAFTAEFDQEPNGAQPFR